MLDSVRTLIELEEGMSQSTTVNRGIIGCSRTKESNRCLWETSILIIFILKVAFMGKDEIVTKQR